MLKTILSIVIAIIAVLIILVVAIQEGKNPGFQGEPVDNSEYGRRHGKDVVLSKITAFLGLLFIVFTLVLAIIS